MDERTREDRIREYAYTWWQFRQMNGRPGNAFQDWEKACHMVDGEISAEIRAGQAKYIRQHSKAKCSIS